VLLSVRHPGHVRRIVARTNQVSQIRRDDRTDRVPHDDNPQAVAKRRFEHIAVVCGGECRSGGEQQRSDQ